MSLRPFLAVAAALLAACLASAGAAAGAPAGDWRFGVVFGEPSDWGREGGAFVDGAGGVRWSGAAYPSARLLEGFRGDPRGVWRSRSAGGTRSRTVQLASEFATRDVNGSGAGLVTYQAPSRVRGQIFAFRRTPSGRAAFGARPVSAPGADAFLRGAEIDDRANSVLLWKADGGPLLARRMSGRGTLGPAETISSNGDGVLSVAGSGRVAVLYSERAAGTGVAVVLRVAAAGPTGRFGAPRTIATLADGAPLLLDVEISNEGRSVATWLVSRPSPPLGDPLGTLYAAGVTPSGIVGPVRRLSTAPVPLAATLEPSDIAVSRSGRFLVAWQERRRPGPGPADAILASASDDSLQFGPAQLIERSTAVATPVAAVDGRGQATVAWNRTASGPGGPAGPAAATGPLGARFAAPQALAPGARTVETLKIAAGGRGTTAVAWKRFRLVKGAARSVLFPSIETAIRRPK